MKKELICISCPLGCHLTVDADNKTVTGKFCGECGTKKPEKPAGKFCPNCGAKISDTAKFCGECGTKIQ